MKTIIKELPFTREQITELKKNKLSFTILLINL